MRLTKSLTPWLSRQLTGDDEVAPACLLELCLPRVKQYGLKDKDLVPYLGRSGRVSEVLNYRRKLTLTMIRKLHSGLNIPTESLVQDHPLKNAS